MSATLRKQNVELGAVSASDKHPCPKGDGCALNKGAVHCFHCKRNWPPDHTWVTSVATKKGRAA